MIPLRHPTEQGVQSLTPISTQNSATSAALSYISSTLSSRLSPLARSASVSDVYEALTAAVYLMSSAASPQFVSRDCRLRSFERDDVWKRQGRTQSAEELAESGFYYMDEADHVKCFFCDLGLRDWDAGDSPELEHAKFSPLCFFLKSSRGLDWLRRSSPRPPNFPASYTRQDHNQLLQILAQKLSSSQFDDIKKQGFCRTKMLLCVARNFIHGRQDLSGRELLEKLLADQELENSDQAPSFSGKFDLAGELYLLSTTGIFARTGPPVLQESSEDSSTSNLCFGCRLCVFEIVFIPCGHLKFCRQCSSLLKLCPVRDCGKQISEKQRAFLC